VALHSHLLSVVGVLCLAGGTLASPATRDAPTAPKEDFDQVLQEVSHVSDLDEVAQNRTANKTSVNNQAAVADGADDENDDEDSSVVQAVVIGVGATLALAALAVGLVCCKKCKKPMK